jgi:hypothetical protein
MMRLVKSGVWKWACLIAVLVLDGVLRRPIPDPTMATLSALAGREVAIVDDPPGLVFEADEAETPAPPVGLVRVRSGPLTGQVGTWAGLAGPRRFGAGTLLEAGFVRIRDQPPTAIPLADLERWA